LPAQSAGQLALAVAISHRPLPQARRSGTTHSTQSSPISQTLPLQLAGSFVAGHHLVILVIEDMAVIKFAGESFRTS
jgi:hypothetical protein